MESRKKNILPFDFGNTDRHGVLQIVSGSFIAKCAVTSKSGEHCPEKPTKKINGDYVCDRCYENWKHLENNDR